MEPTSRSGPMPWRPYRAGLTPLHGRAMEQDLAACYAHLRRLGGPVVPVEIAPGVAAWLVLTHREVLEVIWRADHYSSDPRRWDAAAHGRLREDTPALPLLGPHAAVFRLDGEEHLRHRRALTEALSHLDPRQLGRLVRHRANALVDSWSVRGTADLMAGYARPLVWEVFAHLLGLSDDSFTTLGVLSQTVVNGFPDAVRADAKLLNTFRRVVDERSVTPAPDLASWLVQDTALSDDEVAHNLLALALIGGESTIGWIGNSVRLLLAHQGPALVTGTGDSVSRLMEQALHAGAPMPNIPGRWATGDTILAGHPIRQGDLVIPCLAAANTDPELEGATASRTRAHLAWGTGTHGCPAKDAARLISETALEVLLDRLAGLRPVLPDSALRHPSLWCGAPAELPVTFAATNSDTRRGTVASPQTVVKAPAERRADRAPHEAPPQRWGWWNSFGGW
ncbi:cytochrome P450 [Streptomyces sp. Ag109_G2-15]|uniref:cytochrome P450 n=1 Tax=Streptomyces sp. Ag109_G2-15 TaxID=1938850 RepID=UPI000BD46928|nr:cytochrome P450 [Streptomyces sp. Ag109_G2-15]SOE07528.1 Cytochrome P450 [Streptomyces sp. Ag109_G2-15]